jgi:hypothetical protein
MSRAPHADRFGQEANHRLGLQLALKDMNCPRTLEPHRVIILAQRRVVVEGRRLLPSDGVCADPGPWTTIEHGEQATQAHSVLGALVR